jgi:hypothetical protein
MPYQISIIFYPYKRRNVCFGNKYTYLLTYIGAFVDLRNYYYRLNKMTFLLLYWVRTVLQG